MSISFTPTSVGTITGSVVLTDNASNTNPAQQTISLSGTGQGQAPAFTSPNGTTFLVGSPGSFTVTATGLPQPTLSIVGTLPAGVTFNSATGVFSGTPVAGSAGTYLLTVTAQNAAGRVTQSFILTVSDFTLTAAPGSQTIPSGHDASFTVTLTSLGNFRGSVALSCSGGPPNSSCTLSPSSVALNGTSSATVTVTLSSPTNVNHGTFPLTITATSGSTVHTATVSLTVK